MFRSAPFSAMTVAQNADDDMKAFAGDRLCVHV
jgi:hypothetical protein